MSKFGANLPSVLNPIGDICVEVSIPAHPDYIKLFLRAIRMLEVNRMYARDENLSAKIVVDVWRNRTITPLIEALATGTGNCQDLDGECLTYPPFASFISYSPQNPFTEPDLVPDGFEQPPFFVNGKDNAHDLPNYNKGDVILDFGSINIEPSWDLAKTPRIELCLEGSGVAEIHFLNIVQGGVAIISLDNPVDLGDIITGIIGDGIDSIDLNQDIVSLPPETTEEIIIEVEVPTEGEHIIYIYFLPTVNDSLIPLGFGGGLREISLCGNLRPCGTPAPEPPPPLEGVTELRPEFQFTPDCGLEYRLRDQENNIVQDWQPVAGWVDNAALCFTPEGGGMATKEDIRDGIYEAFNRLALQVASGQYANLGFTTDEDGILTPTTSDTTDVELPEDDPLTEYDEMLAANYGGTTAVCRALELFFDKTDSYYGTVNGTPAVAQIDTAIYLQAYFPVLDFELVEGLNSYYAYRATNAQLNLNLTAANMLFIFCRGSNQAAINQWLIDSSGFPLAKINAMLSMVKALAPEFYSKYMTDGVTRPSTAYVDAACVKMKTQSYTGLQYGVTRSLVPSPAKGGHRIKNKVSGYYVDPDGDLQDAFWYRTAAGVLTRSNFNFTHGSGANNTPSDNMVPYSATHEYEYTIDLETGNNVWSVQFNRNANMNVASTSPTGGFSIEIEDLGQYTL